MLLKIVEVVMNKNITKSIDDSISMNAVRVNNHNQEITDISSFSLRQTFFNSRECPYCGSHHVLSNGNYKGRKRYICKHCRKSYNDLTKTPFSGIHDLDKIMKYLNCMIKGDSIRKAASIVKISVATSFSWRHKLLNCLNQLPSPKLKNVKEIMELEIPYSHKGQRSILSDYQRNSKLSALFVCDRTGKLDSNSITLINRDKNPLLGRISEISNKHTDIICSTKFSNIFDLSRIKIKTSNSPFNQPYVIFQVVKFWQTWMKRFHGVASKYLNNYLHWFDFLDNSIYSENILSDFMQLLLKH